MRIRFGTGNEGLICTIGETTLVRRHSLCVESQKIFSLSHAMLEALSRATREYSLGMANLANLKRLGGELFATLIPDAEKEKLRSQCDALLLEIEEHLAWIPWELLFDGEEFLCRKHDLGRLLTTSKQAQAQPTRRIRSPLRLLVVACDHGGTLPHAITEGEALAACMDQYPHIRATLLANPSLTQLAQVIRDFDAIHYSGHTGKDREHPQEAGWHTPDGTLTPSLLTTLPGSAPLPLLVFSNACRSAHALRSPHEHTSMTDGLAPAFLLGGVQFYVGSLWDVVDERAQTFALEFWKSIAAGVPVGVAMRRARRESLRTFGEDSLVWAPYVLYGPPGATLLSSLGGVSAVDPDEAMPRPGQLAVRPSAPYKRVSLIERSSLTKGPSSPQDPVVQETPLGPRTTPSENVPIQHEQPLLAPAIPPPKVPQPEVSQPAVPQPGVPQPAISPPEVSQPAVPQLPVPQPAVPQLPIPQPAISVPCASRISTQTQTVRRAGIRFGALLVVGGAIALGVWALWNSPGSILTSEHFKESRTLALIGLSTSSSLEKGAENYAAAMESCLLALFTKDGRYRLLDQARVTALLRERGFGHFYGKHAAQAGQALQADYVVYGEVALVGGRPFFTLFVADSSSQEVIVAETLDGFTAQQCTALGRRILNRLTEYLHRTSRKHKE